MFRKFFANLLSGKSGDTEGASMVSDAPDDDEEECVAVFMPSLIAILLNAEEIKGAPLTEAEVIALRDNSFAAVVTIQVAERMATERGYADIDPDDVWAEWQEARKLHSKE